MRIFLFQLPSGKISDKNGIGSVKSKQKRKCVKKAVFSFLKINSLIQFFNKAKGTGNLYT